MKYMTFLLFLLGLLALGLSPRDRKVPKIILTAVAEATG
jgi:hypothetical protein